MHVEEKIDPERDQPKELPNWHIVSLYSDRQYVCQGKRTKYFIPYDSSDPSPNHTYTLHMIADATTDPVSLKITMPTYLLGREKCCDIGLNSPTISAFHCVIQFRKVKPENMNKLVIKPYIFDLKSTNGTYLNFKRISSKRFIELLDGDVITFGKKDQQNIILKFQIQKSLDYEEDEE